MVGRYEEALIEIEKASLIAREQGNLQYVLGMRLKAQIFIDQGKVEAGLELMKQCTEIVPSVSVTYGWALIETGFIEEGKAILNELEQAPLGVYFSSFDMRDLFIGIYYAHLGDYDKSFEYWSIENKAAFFPWLRTYFVPDEIRKDPRFIQLMRDMNLPDPAPLVYNPV